MLSLFLTNTSYTLHKGKFASETGLEVFLNAMEDLSKKDKLSQKFFKKFERQISKWDTQ